MPAYLITGNPGSGKTTVGLELTRRGLTALDTDEIARWETAEGRAVSQPDHPTEEWLRERRWVWRRRRLHDVRRGLGQLEAGPGDGDVAEVDRLSAGQRGRVGQHGREGGSLAGEDRVRELLLQLGQVVADVRRAGAAPIRRSIRRIRSVWAWKSATLSASTVPLRRMRRRSSACASPSEAAASGGGKSRLSGVFMTVASSRR
jgi:hypothetical protein